MCCTAARKLVMFGRDYFPAIAMALMITCSFVFPDPKVWQCCSTAWRVTFSDDNLISCDVLLGSCAHDHMVRLDACITLFTDLICIAIKYFWPESTHVCRQSPIRHSSSCMAQHRLQLSVMWQQGRMFQEYDLHKRQDINFDPQQSSDVPIQYTHFQRADTVSWEMCCWCQAQVTSVSISQRMTVHKKNSRCVFPE